MTKDIRSFKNILLSAIINSDPQQMKDAVDSVATYCYKDSRSSDEFDEEIFNFVLVQMQRQEFLSMTGAYSLLLLFEFDWALLSSQQKERLRVEIERSYTSFSDWMSCFVLTELLGEYFSDDRAFEILCRLKRMPITGERRTLLPMGFARLAQNTTDAGLREKALSEIRELSGDSSQDVQREAHEMLRKVIAGSAN